MDKQTRSALMRLLDGAIIGAVGGVILGAVGGIFFLTLLVFTLKTNNSAIPKTIMQFMIYGALIGLPIGTIIGALTGAIGGVLRSRKKSRQASAKTRPSKLVHRRK